MASNKNIVLVMGPPNTGKSTSLMNLQRMPSMVYLNTDLKELPFADTFMQNVEVADATQVLHFIDEIEREASVSGAVLDTITFLMQMFERQYVSNAVDGQAAWGAYGNFYREFVHAIKSGTKDYVIFAHEDRVYDEANLQMISKVPIKGAVGKIGVEADFTTILSTKQMPLSKLEGYENDLLHITDEEREDEFKYVFCTRCTKDSVGEKMRSAIGLWDRKELYIDNDMQQVFDRLNKYYGKPA